MPIPPNHHHLPSARTCMHACMITSPDMFSRGKPSRTNVTKNNAKDLTTSHLDVGAETEENTTGTPDRHTDRQTRNTKSTQRWSTSTARPPPPPQTERSMHAYIRQLAGGCAKAPPNPEKRIINHHEVPNNMNSMLPKIATFSSPFLCCVPPPKQQSEPFPSPTHIKW